MEQKTKQLSNSEIADKIIDSRVLNTLWDYIHDIEGEIKGETTKAGYILGFQGTILFVASTKIGGIEDILPKLFLMASFIISATLSFFVIAGRGSLDHINLLDKTRFDRSVALPELKKIYTKAQKSFTKKVRLNNINMLIQMIMLVGILIILLFGTEIKNLLQ